ncbi:9930_t:CDS:2 [Ambispora leptoticha]|uniref:9930_t:CDS:1 n=1 Tax=Ambispora leptoticha TaxID=144679 RepID=A0A9N9FT39_9GLOM|nr:9930_t:CDS:2 [Ambispora leptoticha]
MDVETFKKQQTEQITALLSGFSELQLGFDLEDVVLDDCISAVSDVGMTAEQKQLLLDKLDSQMEARNKILEEQAAQILLKFRLECEKDLENLPPEIRSMSVDEYVNVYHADPTEYFARRAAAQEEKKEDAILGDIINEDGQARNDNEQQVVEIIASQENFMHIEENDVTAKEGIVVPQENSTPIDESDITTKEEIVAPHENPVHTDENDVTTKEAAAAKELNDTENSSLKRTRALREKQTETETPKSRTKIQESDHEGESLAKKRSTRPLQSAARKKKPIAKKTNKSKSTKPSENENDPMQDVVEVPELSKSKVDAKDEEPEKPVTRQKSKKNKEKENVDIFSPIRTRSARRKNDAQIGSNNA